MSGCLHPFSSELLSCGHGRRLNEPQNVTIRVANVELAAVWHVSQWNNEGDISSSKAGGQVCCAMNANADVDVLLLLKSHLIASFRCGVFEVNVAPITGDSRVEALENEIDLESELISVKGQRTRDIPHSEDRCDVTETLDGLAHEDCFVFAERPPSVAAARGPICAGNEATRHKV